MATTTAHSTDFRRVVKRLHHSEERFRLLVESVQDYALFMLDPSGCVASWNPGAERIKGYLSDEIVGRHFSRFYTAEDVAAGKPELVLQAAAVAGRVEDEGWRVRKDGSRFWAHVVITALRDETGKLRGYGKVTRDLTERMRAMRRIGESEARLQAFMHHSPSLMFIKDLDGCYQYVNDQFCRSFGLGQEAVLGHTDAELLSAEQAARFRANDASVIASGVAQEFEEAADYRTGRHVSIVCKFPIRGADGRISAVGGIVTDITARKRAELDLLDRHTALQKAAAAVPAVAPAPADNGVAGLTQMVARDLRAPLRHIEALAVQVQEGLATMNDSARRLTAIAQAASRLSKLSSDLMLFARADQLPQHRSRIDLLALVIEVRNEQDAAALVSRVRWKISELPAVTGDRALLRLVFANLLSNALKFTRGRERAHIDIGTRSAASDEVVITVADNGTGFEPRDAERVFEPFQRLHSVRENEGAGVGLAMAKRIVTSHGGRIWAEGEPGVGARFFVALKRAP